jgi:dolichyl-diphosphooligosaccharide--protein glycosyltransferase/undecaprenyl-diphosphooligosaccharide--protein glycosyltransferase
MNRLFQNKELGYKEIAILMAIAYLFSFAMRLIWVFHFSDNPSYMWNNQLMINTNDGYFFASAVEYLLNGSHANNPRVQLAIDSYPAMIYVSYFLAKFTPMSLETTLLYASGIISSLVVVPIILIGYLIRLPWVGFFSALLGSIGWSYYNRTMIGYYDTDMFSVLLQFVVLYGFILTIYEKSNKAIILLIASILLYPLFYPQGLSLIYAIFMLWVAYQLFFQRDDKNSYIFIAIVSIALWHVSWIIKLILITVVYLNMDKIKAYSDMKKLLYLMVGSIFVFFIFGDVFSLIMGKIDTYMSSGVTEGNLHYYKVIQTVREAGHISWDTVANRIIGGKILLVLSLIGYILLTLKHKVFILALPLLGVGIMAHILGLRFTVYAVPVASFSLIYLFYYISTYVKNTKASYSIFVLLSILALYPNIAHIKRYMVPTVMNSSEVKDLDSLNKIASDKDYTLAWWDYGYPIWFYSDTSTLIDGAKHNDDNFIISTIFQTSSAKLASGLSRLAVESYVDSNYSIVTHQLFKDKNPNKILAQLARGEYKLPQKSRDVYLYMPYKMLDIFPTVMLFGNLDLTTGKKRRNIVFYPTRVVAKADGKLRFRNGIIFDMKKGILEIGKDRHRVKDFIITDNKQSGAIKLGGQHYHKDSDLYVVYMRSYNRFVIMDKEIFKSMYVQMFILGRYDKRYFEPVVKSVYSRVYKLKI